MAKRPRKSKQPATQPLPRQRSTMGLVLVAAAVLIHVVFFLSLQLGWLDPLFNDSTHRLPQGLDFYTVFQKSQDFSVGESLYTVVDYSPAGRRAWVVPYAALHYRYLPSWGWFMSVTFLHLDAVTAYWLWVMCSELMLLLCLWMFLRPTQDRRKQVGLVVMWLCFTPYYLELFLGQFTLVTTGFMTLALFAFDGTKNHRGAAWITLSICIKYFALALLAPLLLSGRWRQVLATSAVVAAILALYFSQRPEDWTRFIDMAAYSTPNDFHAGNLGLQGLFGNVLKLIPDGNFDSALKFLLQKMLPVGLGLYLTWMTWRHRGADNFIPLCLLWISLYFFAGPDVFEHHHLLLLPVFSFAWLRRPSRWLLFLYAWIALPTVFYFVDLPGLPHQRFVEVENLWWDNGQHLRIFIYHLWKVVPVTWLFIWLFGLIDKTARESTPSIDTTATGLTSRLTSSPRSRRD